MGKMDSCNKDLVLIGYCRVIVIPHISIIILIIDIIEIRSFLFDIRVVQLFPL